MTLHLRPETEARLAAHAADLRISIDDYLEALVEKELTVDYGKPLTSTVGQFQKEQGLWFYRTGDPIRFLGGRHA